MMPSTRHLIVQGDARDMRILRNESVHLVVTSPPYWQLKDYGSAGQIGFHQNYESYINSLNVVWDECRRVLHKGCRLCINIGDQFARAAYYGRYKVIPIRTEIIKFCETIGFDYMGAIIWQKVTTTNTTGGATIMGSFPYPRNGILKLDYEFILVFKKHGSPPNIPENSIKEASRMTTEEWNEYFQGHWRFSGAKQTDHLAEFPEELPRRLIKMFSFVGETILDPFAGSGTTMRAAMNLGRNSYAYEINRRFIPLIRKKLDTVGLENLDITFIREPPVQSRQLQERIAGLPYRFSDPQKIDKKADPRLRSFGSRINGRSDEREEYFIVREVLSPEALRLDDGRTIRLIGVKQNPSTASATVDYLVKRTKGRKVFLRFDVHFPEDSHPCFCYLYLANRTFLNVHLVKSGLVSVDEDQEFTKKEHFLRYVSSSS